MTSRPRTSVVIPTFNAATTIGDQLAALVAQDCDALLEVVVCDNGSTDDLDRALDPFRDKLDLRVVRAPDVQGVSHARNVGCRAARGELILICDADDIVSEGWAAAMVAAAGFYDIVGGRLDTRRLNPPDVQRWRVWSAHTQLPVHMGHLPYAPGCNIALWSRVFHEVGGWDEGLRGGGDDVDFSWRAQEQGFTLGFAPEGIVHYRLRPDLRSAMRQVRTYQQARPQLLRRHGGAGARPSSARDVLGSVAWLVTRAPYAVAFGSWRHGRWWLNAAALQGRLRASVRSRIWAM